MISAPGMKNGDTRRGPFSFRISAVSAIDCSPPMPEPMITPGALALRLVLGRPAGVAHRLVGGGHRVEDEGVDLALVLGRHPVVGVERAVRTVAERHLAGDVGREVLTRRTG